MNVRHDIDHDLVQQNIQEKIEIFEKLRLEAKKKLTEELKEYNKSLTKKTTYRWCIPENGDYEKIDSIYDKYIEKEKNRYSTVKVLEINNKDENSFYLIYESEDIFVIDGIEYHNEYLDNGIGTGPFETFDKAKDWFLKFGR